MINHNNQNKIALINDYTGFGRCSVAVQLPVISMLKVQCCPLPTSIFSNHTGFESFSFKDYTDFMPTYMEEWGKLDLHFNGILTGFLGSAKQIDIVSDFIDKFKTDETTLVVDPVMGDYGRLYPTYTEDMQKRMIDLVRKADIVTPNLTEACFLTGTDYKDVWKMKELRDLAKAVATLGPSKIVITGIPQKSFICNMCYERGESDNFGMIKTHAVGTSRSGTGDVFSSIICADAVNDVAFYDSVRKASRFIKKCILKAIELDIPVTDGVPFEEILHTLKV